MHKKALKFDKGKLRYDLVSPIPLEEFLEVLALGAESNGERCWKKIMDCARLYGATMRYLLAWWNGEGYETGLIYPTHAASFMDFFQHYEDRNSNKDSRSKR